jgi:hypothetical protein
VLGHLPAKPELAELRTLAAADRAAFRERFTALLGSRRELAAIAVVRVEADASLRRGVVTLPHGYGQAYPTAEGRVVVGPRLNFLTANDDCDPIAATPHHKNVRGRLVPLDPVRAAKAAADAARAQAVVGHNRGPLVPGDGQAHRERVFMLG